MVGNIADKAKDLTIHEYRLGEVDIRQVGTSGRVRIVGDEQVPRPNVVTMFFEQSVHQPVHGSDVYGQGIDGLNDQAARAIHDCG